jgi:hypothetical protein
LENKKQMACLLHGLDCLKNKQTCLAQIKNNLNCELCYLHVVVGRCNTKRYCIAAFDSSLGGKRWIFLTQCGS